MKKDEKTIGGVLNTDRGLVAKPDESTPYQEMDTLDEKAIVSAYTDQSFEGMVYDIPFGDSNGKAPKTCHKDGCTYKGKSHAHVTGVGIQGINELVQLMGGIVIEIVECRPIKKHGRDWWWAKAVARDQFSMTERYGEGECPAIMKRGGPNDMRGDFPKIIAQSKAERNAARKILPQAVLDGIAKLALKGKTRFSEEDLALLFKPFWTTRSALKAQWMNALIQNRLGGGGSSFTSPVIVPSGHTKAVISTSTGSTEITLGEPNEPGRPTPKQWGFMIGLLKKSGEGFTEETAKEYLADYATTPDQASKTIKEFKDGDFKKAIDWLDKKAQGEEK